MSSLSAAIARFPRSVVLLAGLAVGLLMVVGGLDVRVDRLFDPLRAVLAGRVPSGRVVVVEMDAASVGAIRRWPWPREHYAAVVDRLRAAGAGSITFDVDLSSANTPAGDRRLAAALARADGLIALPTFAQQARSGDTRSIDSLPLPMFRPHVALASVSMQPDPDGVVRRAPFATITAGVPRPSLSAYIARRSGTADTFFPIDFGIDPAALPRISFIDVRDGRFPPALVRGRDVLIGATAIEMGDRYATPHWGVIPGVIVQALAAETLIHGVPTAGSTATMMLAALILAMAILIPRSSRWAYAGGVLAMAAVIAGVIAAQAVFNIIYPLATPLAMLGAIGIGRLLIDIGHRLEIERCVDQPTGLGNRSAMVRDVAAESGGLTVVVTIGNFDAVATLLGEQAGHDLILRLADRITIASDAPVYRIGDRLLAVKPGVSADDLADYFDALRALLIQPVEIAGRRIDAAVHLGTADGGASLQDRLLNATRAAAEAAATSVFRRDSAIDVDAMERRIVLMGELDQAIECGQIEVHYQPKLSIAEDRISSVEALVRWRHPTRGMIRPDIFIPLAEQADRISALTCFVIDRTMRDLARWQLEGFDLTAAINISATLVAEPSFVEAVDALLGRQLVPPESLTFEVTESATLAEPERAATILRGYRDRGIGVSMDDYGTGQSSLSYLRQLPLTELKIDRSFVQHAHLNRPDELMVQSTIALAHDLGLKVVAEGVEDEGCLAFLRSAGCDMAQGYLVSRPVPALVISELLGQREVA
ncbi:EAL domain-containing protein (putative c-di-GMP-specific phosphodiesterase class I)/CHASE2 domain-containing sensor protein [Sphingomonas jinjuensis]|uniref:EAL domain-containing protein (Putative c-di-GMP-specific phosphodiesterase class I)/CHASE2 domain-containing sensor protein n=1 Tax=Sphingomonas jinjuensis TaxID=535907 RepID=A0A840FEF7_9SPHN|nr:EAL domain-containing protein [Sphingomonas jinjuensis]MBB4153997.1 EAL domain-containing protein (putative c-di-GMP-specific phosphodiesterase class I)/CHASE2 domain-containing sensor protein [Sphingomonas jinjuensis]